MVLVVDGPDASGKTTLVKRLEKVLEIPWIVNYQTTAGESGNERETYVQALSFKPYIENFEFIFDRFLMTCAVYNMVFRDGKYVLKYLELMKKFDILTIYIQVPWELLKANLFRNKLEEREDIKKRLKEIHLAFEKFYRGLVEIVPQKIICIDGLLSTDVMLRQLVNELPASWKLKVQHYLWRKRCRNR